MGKIILGEIELTPQQEVETVSGNVETVSGNVETLSSTTTAHTADATAHVTAADKTKWNTVDDKLDATAYTPTDLSNYYQKSETSGKTEISTALSGKSNTGHGHSISDVTNLQTTLDGKSGTGHTHSQYLTGITNSQVTTALGFTPTNNTAFTAHTADTTAHITQALLDRITILENLTFYNGHAYVEIGGDKWATMNIGASSITDYGLKFQWGDTQGYMNSQCGNGNVQKYFGWTDYKYGDGTSSPDSADMVKYNSTDGLRKLDALDDAAQVNWGGKWRMPTTTEIYNLGMRVNTAWTSDYNSTGVAGVICTAKDGSGAQLFFPAAGSCNNGVVNDAGSKGWYWSSSVSTSDSKLYAYPLYFRSDKVVWQNSSERSLGLCVRGIVG